jgi:CHAT domain
VISAHNDARDGAAVSARASRSSSRGAVQRLAASLRLLEEHRRRQAHFAAMLTQLQGVNLVTVTGEEDLLAAVESRLEEAAQILDALENDAAVIDDALGELGAVLDGYEWEVLDSVGLALARKLKKQDELILELQANVDEWTSRLEPARTGINDAIVARAPVARERAAVDRMVGLVTAAQRALSDRRYTDVNDPIRRLAESEEPPETLAERVREKITATQRFSGRAEVLLLHSIAGDLHSYSVLLRTPSEVGTHGFNIQDSSSLVDQDRHYIREAIAQIIQAVDPGIVRDLRPSEEAGTQASPQPGDMVRDARPELPPQSAQDTAALEDLPTLVREVGEVMFRLIAPDRMRQYLSSNPCSLMITTNDLELPWELMYDESLDEPASEERLGFLCLQRPIARMPMGRAFPRLRPVTQPKAKLRFLLIYADPDQNLPAAGREVHKIKSALEPRSSDDDIEVTVLRGEEVTGKKLNKALLTGRYDVIHFAGHAHFSEVDPDLSSLLLHGHERFLSQKIERFVEGQPLVFLNACQTGRTANADTPQSVGEYFWKPAEGLASAFLYGGALGCVGSLWPVYDDPAAEFAIEFYHHVLEGQMLGEAMRLARRTTRENHPESITWASFVLYGDPTYRLVR